MSYHSFKYIVSYVHNNRIGVLVEFGMRSNFTARVEEVEKLMKDVALHIAASDPVTVDELLGENFIKEPDKKVSEVLVRVSDKVSDPVAVISRP